MNTKDTQARVVMDLSIDQAQVLSSALDLYTRLGLGQLEQIDELVRFGAIPAGSMLNDQPDFGAIEALAHQLKLMLGYMPGSSWGIGSEPVPLGAKRAYEMKKTIDQVLAIYLDPNPSFRGVNYDGVTVRYTKDVLPSALVQESEKPADTRARPKGK